MDDRLGAGALNAPHVPLRPPDSDAPLSHTDDSQRAPEPAAIVLREFCQVPRCRRKRRQQHQRNGRFLFSGAWRQATIAGVAMWVLDVTTRCADCGAVHVHTLVPPAVLQILVFCLLLILDYAEDGVIDLFGLVDLVRLIA